MSTKYNPGVGNGAPSAATPAAYTTAGDVPITAAALGNASIVRVVNSGSTVLPVTLDASLLASGRVTAFMPAVKGQAGFYLRAHTNIPDANWIVEGGGTVVSAEADNNTIYVACQDDGIARVLGALRARVGGKITAAIVGDSHTGRHYDPSVPLTNMTALGAWNWANAMCGDAFEFQNYGWSGDTIAGITARAMAVPASIQVVFLNAGTNDVLALSAAASAGTVTAAVNASMALLNECINALVLRGQKVVITTIYPNNAYTPNTDARISYLNQLNAAIMALHNGRTVWAVDSFTALRDAAAPTLGTAAANYMDSGGTHLSNLGAQVAGEAAKATLAAVARACSPDVNIYDGAHLAQGLYCSLRTSTGGNAGLMSFGTGTIADGWRWLNTTLAGTSVGSVGAVSALPASYVGRSAAISAEKMQTFVVDPVTAGGSCTFRALTAMANGNTFEGLHGGGQVFAEYDVELVAPSLVTNVYADLPVFVTLGTSPVDQGYSALSGGSVSARAMNANVLGNTPKNMNAFRGVYRTPVVRVPENISGITVQVIPSVIVEVASGGRFEIRISSPRFWVKHADRF